MGNVLRAYSLAFAGLLTFATSLGLGSLAAHADTLEWALVQAYQNNPSLNAQRASLRATDENVPQALSGYRPKLSLTATGGYNYQNATSVVPGRRRSHHQPIRAELLFAHDRRQRHLHPVQRLPDRQSDPSGGKPGGCGARDLACHRAAGAARCRDRLHESVARSGGARSAAAQRRSSDRTAQADARPFQRRRSNAHRRSASRIAARRRTLATSRRPVAIRDIASELSPGDRRRSGHPRCRARLSTGCRPTCSQGRSRKARRKAPRFLPRPMASMLPSSPSRSAKARSIRTSR